MRYDVTFETTAEFHVVVEADDADTAEEMVSNFSIEVNWYHVSISDFGMYDLNISEVTRG